MFPRKEDSIHIRGGCLQRTVLSGIFLFLHDLQAVTLTVIFPVTLLGCLCGEKSWKPHGKEQIFLLSLIKDLHFHYLIFCFFNVSYKTHRLHPSLFTWPFKNCALRTDMKVATAIIMSGYVLSI